MAVQMDGMRDAVSGAVSLYREDSGGRTYRPRKAMTLF